jgi:hypothetical protein
MQKEKYSMKAVAPTAAAILGLDKPASAAESPISSIMNDLSGSKHLAVLAPDALGILPWRLWKHKMPFLSSLHEKKSILLEAVMPSTTPVNFACMLTGAELDVHGMNKPYLREGEWVNFKCETLFDVVRRAGGKSAGAGQKGYTGELLLARCADFSWVSECGPASTVSDMITSRFNLCKPELLIAQFANVDTAFHRLGPSNPEVVPVLEELDFSLEKLVEHLVFSGAGIILLAEHRQQDVLEPVEGRSRGTHGTELPEDMLVPCTWVSP